jgi:hypothetical protein
MKRREKMVDKREMTITIKQLWVGEEFLGWDGSVIYDGEEVMSTITDTAWDALEDTTRYIADRDSTVSRKWMEARK